MSLTAGELGQNNETGEDLISNHEYFLSDFA